jgi:heme exporter protein D
MVAGAYVPGDVHYLFGVFALYVFLALVTDLLLVIASWWISLGRVEAAISQVTRSRIR